MPGKGSIDVAPPPESYADIKPGLSDEELAALKDDDDESGADDEVAGGGESEGDAESRLASPRPEDQQDQPAAAPGDTNEGATDPDAGPVEDDQTEAAAPPETPKDDEIPRGQQLETRIRPSRDMPQDIPGAIQGIDTQLDALETALDEGEIELKEFLRQSRTLQNQRQELVADAREMEIIQNASSALAETNWNASVAQFMGANPNFQNPIMQGALQAALNELYQVPDNVGASHQWYLETARRAVLQQITPAEATAANPPDNEDSPQQQRAQQIQAQSRQRVQAANKARAEVPQTLSNIPADQDNASDEFSALDNLSGVELESALAKMSPEQQDRYLRAGQ